MSNPMTVQANNAAALRASDVRTTVADASPSRNRTAITLRFVVHSRVLDYLNCGWHIACADLGPPHSQYAVLLSWLCPCKTVEPTK